MLSIRTRVISLVVLASYLLGGCSLFANRTEMIQVSSEPSDAQVLSNGKPVGQTPVSFEADRGEALLIEVKKQGYETQTRVGSKKLSQVGLLDVIGGVFFLVPLLGLLSSGAWAHDPQQYGLTLEPVK